MSWASTAPSARTALAAGFASALPTVAVINGKRVSSELLDEAVRVGYRDDTTPAVEGQFAAGGFAAAAPSREAYTVNCAVTVVTGEDDYLPFTERAYELLAACGGWLAANPTLTVDGKVMSAQPGAWSQDEIPGPTATFITLVFGVDIDAFTTV